jgi:hypothetical protein
VAGIKRQHWAKQTRWVKLAEYIKIKLILVCPLETNVELIEQSFIKYRPVH